MVTTPVLFEYEGEHLLDVLRTNLRVELRKAGCDSPNAYWHQINARATLRLLEIFNPRQEGRGMYSHRGGLPHQSDRRPGAANEQKVQQVDANVPWTEDESEMRRKFIAAA